MSLSTLLLSSILPRTTYVFEVQTIEVLFFSFLKYNSLSCYFLFTFLEKSPTMAKQFIYHEKQSAALCGVHCLNNLLQGPYTNAGSLAEIAHELDAQERELMLSQGNKAIQNL